MSRHTQSIKKQKTHIKVGLLGCTHAERVLFVKMYGPREQLTDAFLFNVDKMAKHNINEIVDQMSDDQLRWAATQVENTVQKKRNGD